MSATSDTEATTDPAVTAAPVSLWEVTLVSLKLGILGFGGPAAHIAMLHEEVVTRRKWTTNQQFLDLLGATNLIPGPNSTEMVMHIGYGQSRLKGLLSAGLCFILPASLITLLFAWLYAIYGTTAAGVWLMYGVKPVVIAVILSAVWSLGRTVASSPLHATIGVVVTALALAGVNELAILFGAGLATMLIKNRRRLIPRGPVALAFWSLPVPLHVPSTAVLAATTTEPYSALQLFLLFLRIGATLYGSGYVLIAFIQADLVDRLGWLTESQLIDAVAVGQFTPGPVSSTATFVGYLVGGWWGAIVATIGIFLPAFVLVAITNPLVPRLRQSDWAGGFLDGVNVAAIGLMVAVVWELGRAALVDPVTVALAVGSLLGLVILRINSVWLIIAGAAVGLIFRGWLPL